MKLVKAITDKFKFYLQIK